MLVAGGAHPRYARNTGTSEPLATATQLVTVSDNTVPTITGRPIDASYQFLSGVPAANANDATATDNCGVPTRTVLDTNITGIFNVTRAVVPHMIARRAGKIINISSVAGEKGGRGQTNYAASKGAVNAFTRALAVELAPRRITVNTVAPGVIETEMSQAIRDHAGEQVTSRILLRRFGTPAEVAYAVWFLASRFADYITGEVLNVDGGFKME